MPGYGCHGDDDSAVHRVIVLSLPNGADHVFVVQGYIPPLS